MAYPPPSPPYYGPVSKSSGNGNKPLTRLVIHCTAGADGKGSTGTAEYFRSAAAKGSAHYITDANLTIQSAYDSVVCWHAPPNMHSIGIEMCCSLSSRGQGHWELASHVKMMQRTARLTAELCLAYNIPVVKLTVAQVRAGQKGICGHWDVSRAFGQSSHWDPGEYFPWATFMTMVRAEVADIVAGGNPDPGPDDALEWFDMATLDQIEQAMAAGTETGNANYWRRFFSDEQGTGDAALDDMRAGFMNIVQTVAGATDEVVAGKLDALGVKMQANTDAINRLAAALEATIAPKA
jgi:hypothetical protein